MKRFYASILVTALAVLAPLSAAPTTDGTCSPAEAAAGLCLVSPDGFVVEAITGPGGEFPLIDANGNSVFSYLVTGPGVNGGSCSGVNAVSHASILVPVGCAGGDLVIVDAHPAAELLAGGQGDPACGPGDPNFDVLKWDDGVACDSSRVFTLVLEGIVPAVPIPLTLKAGSSCSTDTIMGPGCPDVVRYCPATSSSTGQPVQIDFSGSLSIADNDFHLHASGLPANQTGFFFFGTQEDSFPLGNGTACIGGQIFRLPKSPFQPDGTTVLHVDFTVPPGSAIVAGIPHYFQLFYRDPLGGGAGFNASDGLIVTFSP